MSNNITVLPTTFDGEIILPPSKSDVHRAIICACLAKGKSVVAPVDFSRDILATIDCMRNLGAEILTFQENKLYINGSNIFSPKSAELDCDESGSTLRFLIPIAGVGGMTATFSGKGRLPMRPIGIYLDVLPEKGVCCETFGGLPLQISGKLKGGIFKVRGDISSQFITGLLLALPLAEEDSEIILTTPLQSKSYIDMTLNTLSKFGIKVVVTPNGYFIKGNQQYKPCQYTCESDWSQAGFFFSAGALGGNVTVRGLSLNSIQGDRAGLDIFRKFGAEIIADEEKITVKANKNTLHGIEINAENIPDLVPILAVTGAFAKGTTYIHHAQRLRIKESDRLKAISDNLNRIGCDVKETADGLILHGIETAQGGLAEGYNDHRIVMSMSIAVARCHNPITITDRHSIDKSYPQFFNDYQCINGKIELNG